MKKTSSLTTIIVLAFATVSAGQEVPEPVYSEQMKQAIKFELLAPLSGNFTVGYEKYVKDFLSMEYKIGIIGAGINIENQMGLFFKVGPRLKMMPDYMIKGLKGTHLLSGKYIKPELALSFFSKKPDEGSSYSSYSNSTPTKKESVQSVAFIVNYGKQSIVGGSAVFDWSFGVGYGYTSQEYGGNEYSHTSGGSEFPMVFSASLALGFLIK